LRIAESGKKTTHFSEAVENQRVKELTKGAAREEKRDLEE
jgi:hypothetical protein